MTISKESFETLFKHDQEVIKSFIELKQRINGLIKTLSKVKRIRKEVKDEITAYVKLIEISLTEIEKGNKQFEKWTVSYLDSLPKISNDVKEKLDEYKKKLGTLSYDETIQELFIVLESYFKQNK